jgi:dTDP-4-dehydrorhamnose 3,5-epimerase
MLERLIFMLSVEATRIPEVRIVEPTRIRDARGFFAETWNRRRFEEAGIGFDFVQTNQSLSTEIATLRGLHFQSPPFAQDKLVQVTRGRVLDVAVDIRVGSPSFGRHVAVELSALNGKQLLVPAGFAHGFCTLEPDSEVMYQVTAHYSGPHDHGLAFDDPDLAIDWPFPGSALTLSDKDRGHPRLRDLAAHFTWSA